MEGITGLPAIEHFGLHLVPLFFVYKRRSVSEEQFKQTFHAHTGVEILIVHEGTGTLILDQRSYAVSPGTICVFQPYQLHDIVMDVSEDKPFVRSIVHYEPAHYEAYFDHWPSLQGFYNYLNKSSLGAPCRFGPEAMDALSPVLADMNGRMPGLTRAQYYEEFSLFLLAFLRAFKPHWERAHIDAGKTAHDSRTLHPVERIMGWVERHYREPFRLEKLSRELHLSAHHLSHLFKESTGGSITDYVTAKRMQQAVTLLLSGDESISRIAEEVGMPNCSHFCKQFKARFGSTPHQYRKRVQEANGR
jgi:AraC-like DNA-binding protein